MTTTTTASIYDMMGSELTTGLQPSAICDEAILTAQRIADERGEDVHLVDDDGEWIVHPARPNGTRAGADRHA